jgi:hypothetical protein
MSATLKATGLMVSDDRLWYGADLKAQKQPAGAVKASPAPSAPVPAR